ncbi:MAG: (Fe-S)-binding protein [Proteobacteria bacterium]|nr:(Fe-S)-binding protein [Pseudomonadota bacterium]
MDRFAQIDQCNRCGFCQEKCPIFRVTGHEAGVARGRLALLSALRDGSLDWSDGIEEPLFACLLCGACTANCFPAVPTADMILEARREYLERSGRKPLHRLLFDHLLPYPGRLRLAARGAAVLPDRDVSRVARALGLLRFLGRDFPKALDIVGRVPARPLRDGSAPRTFAGQDRTGPAIGYFVGCGMDLVRPEAARETLALLGRLGRSVELLPNGCCGLPAETYGDRRAARKLAERNLRLLAGRSLDLIVTDCSSCAAFLKKYPRLFEADDPWQETAAVVSSRVRDLLEVLSRIGPGDEPQGEKWIVTYHDPCHASRGQGLTKPPRDFLASLPGVEYREMEEADWCCGGAGSYALAHYDLARRVLERKIDHIEKTGAQVVASSCPACLVHLDYGCRMRGLPVRAVHISRIANRGRSSE